MEAAAKKEAEELERKKLAEIEKAKVEAARKLLEEANNAAKGLEDRIAGIEKALKGKNLSNKAKYDFEQILKGLVESKKKEDEIKRKAKAAKEAAEKAEKEKAAKIEAERKKKEAADLLAKKNAKLAAEAKAAA